MICSKTTMVAAKEFSKEAVRIQTSSLKGEKAFVHSSPDWPTTSYHYHLISWSLTVKDRWFIQSHAKYFDSACPFPNSFQGWLPRWFCLTVCTFPFPKFVGKIKNEDFIFTYQMQTNSYIYEKYWQKNGQINSNEQRWNRHSSRSRLTYSILNLQRVVEQTINTSLTDHL